MSLIVIPSPAADSGLCHVYGYIETPDNQPAANVELIFELITTGASASNRIIANRKVTVKTDNNGYVSTGAGYVPLQRNDTLTPSGSTWRVTSKALGLVNHEFTLTTETFDLLTLIT
jgi:hypothetical protein